MAPRNELEETLVEIWAEVLKIEQIGVFDNFFELGGHSLLAAKVIARVRKYLGVEVPLRDLFEEPTVAGSGRALWQDSRRAARRPAPRLCPDGSDDKRGSSWRARLRELSDEEIDALLTAALAQSRTSGEGDD